MNNKKIILAMLICIPVLLLMVSTVSAGDLQYRGEDANYQLDTKNTVDVYSDKIDDDTTLTIDFNKATPIKKEKDDTYSTTIKSGKNTITVKKPTKKVKTVKFTYTQSDKKLKKQLKKIKAGKADKWALAGPYGHTNIKKCKLLKDNKIKSYKIKKTYHKSYSYTDNGVIIKKHPIYKVTVKYYVCKKVKKYLPVHVYIKMDWKKYDSGVKKEIGELWIDSKYLTSDYPTFDTISPEMLAKLKR